MALSARATLNGGGGGGSSIPPLKWSTVVTEIERLGLSYKEDSHFELNRIDIENRRVQVREMNHIAPKESVKRFAEQMSTTEFPPIIMTEDDYIVDGNTRVEAARSRKITFLPAFVLPEPFGSATPDKIRKIKALAATLNCNAGVALTVAERRRAVPDLLALNWRVEQIRRALGLTTGAVAQIKKELEAKARLDKLGLVLDAKKESILLRGLGATSVMLLKDKPFNELAILARESGLKSREIATLAKEMRETGSEEAEIELIAKKRREMHERIVEHHLTGNGKPSRSSQLRRCLGFILGFEGREEELVEKTLDNIANHLDVISRSIKVLTKTEELHKPQDLTA
jgi:disulfide oxidoreductase YuzD